jgi:hypothetical protein
MAAKSQRGILASHRLSILCLSYGELAVSGYRADRRLGARYLWSQSVTVGVLGDAVADCWPWVVTGVGARVIYRLALSFNSRPGLCGWNYSARYTSARWSMRRTCTVWAASSIR